MFPSGSLTVPDAFSHEAWSNDQDPMDIESIEKPLAGGKGGDCLPRADVRPKSAIITLFEKRYGFMLVFREQ